MLNYKYILAAGTAMLIPVTVAADTCSTLPSCASIGFTYSAADCGTLKKLKCPFGDAYFCSGSNCKSVSLNANTEVCTKYCEEDRNVCVEKRPMTCSELLSKNNCTRYNNGSTISGTISKDICLFGTVKQATGSYSSSLSFVQMNAYDAGLRWPACESEMTGRAKLDLNYASIKNHASFYTDLDLNSITYSPQGTTQNWSGNFYGNTRIKIDWQSSTVWNGDLSLTFQGRYDGNGNYTKTTNTVVIRCQPAGDRWNPSKCNVHINNYYADVTYCGMIGSDYMGSCGSGSSDTTCYGENNITCNSDYYGGEQYGTCKEDNGYGYCEYYWN